MNELKNMKVFCRIIELGTFTAVAKEMDLSSMMISKYMAQLEKSLGVVLLNRSTRNLFPTEAGLFFYNRSKQLLEDFQDLEESTAQLSNTVKGTLKINAPVDFGEIFMIPAIESYQQQYPEVQITLSLNNNAINLRKGEVDLAILVTDTLDPGVVARKIAQTELNLYASPSYLAKNTLPQTLEDLSSHHCLHYTNSPHANHWIFNDEGNLIKIKYNWQLASNNSQALCKAAMLGMGLVQLPKLSVIPYLKNKQLIEILPDYKIPALFVYATYLQRRFYPAKLTTFIEFLSSFIKNKV